MKKTIKILLLLIVIAIASVAIYQPFSASHEIQKRTEQALKDAGFKDVEVVVGTLSKQDVNFSRIAFAQEEVKVEMKALQLHAEQLPIIEIIRGNYANIQATWQVEELNVAGIAYPLPPLIGKGTVAFANNKPEIKGDLKSKDALIAADFFVNSSEVRVPHIQLPWEGAIISAKDVEYSFVNPKPLYLILYVKELKLARILSLITDDKATGTGDIAGAVPVIIAPDGSFKPGEGRFTSQSAGVITISPDALPGDSKQMEMAREALTDFHYKSLILKSDTDDSGKLTLMLSLDGNNPNAFDGRPINLNVKLTGDVLELLQQTLIPSSDPTKFLEHK